MKSCLNIVESPFEETSLVNFFYTYPNVQIKFYRYKVNFSSLLWPFIYVSPMVKHGQQVLYVRNKAMTKSYINCMLQLHDGFLLSPNFDKGLITYLCEATAIPISGISLLKRNYIIFYKITSSYCSILVTSGSGHCWELDIMYIERWWTPSALKPLDTTTVVQVNIFFYV